MVIKHRTLDDFLKEVVIDCWNGMRDETELRVECRRLGGSSDGSVNYRLEATYKITPADCEPVNPLVDNFSLDRSETPEDFKPHVVDFLNQYGISSSQSNGTMKLGSWALREHTLAPHQVARMLGIHETEVHRYYRRTRNAEVHGQTKLNCRDVMAIGREQRLSDEQILEHIKRFYSV